MKKLFLLPLFLLLASITQVNAMAILWGLSPWVATSSISQKSIDKIQGMMESNVPVWIIVLVVGIAILLTFLLLFSYKGSRKNKKRKRTIFR